MSITFGAVLLLLHTFHTTVHSQYCNDVCPCSSNGLCIGADGFESDICLRLTDFSIDGDWWATSSDEIDWSSVLEGTRTTADNAEYSSTQNQCHDAGTVRKGWYYKAGVFCDLFDNIEHSQFQNGPKHDMDCCPFNWVPVRETPMQDKGDLTNVYYVGSAWDLKICAAFERIDVNGASYMDMEFNQRVVDDYEATLAATGEDYTKCHEDIYYASTNTTYTTDTTWRCRYVNRTSTDIQISFIIANDITDNIIVISSWDPLSISYKPIRTERMTDAADPYYYLSDDLAFEAAVNSGPIAASSFGWICDDKDPNLTYSGGCPTIEETGQFFEACIDFKKLGFTSLDFNSVIIKARASSNGAYKDTSGVLWNRICGPEDCVDSDGYPEHNPWNPTREDYGCANKANLTPFPTRVPTEPTVSPTGYPSVPPTENTTAPSEAPTETPTEVTGAPVSPTSAPSEPTPAPTGDTAAPTRSTTEPTAITNAPTKGPTVTDGEPSKAPTHKPSDSPTDRPTVADGEPSQAPTERPSDDPSAAPSDVPSAAPTETQTCEDDDDVLRTDCADEAGSGCFAQFNISVNVCLLGRKFSRSSVYSIVKNSLIELYERNPLNIDACSEDEVRIEKYYIDYADDAAQTAAESADCSSCGTDTGAYTIYLVVGMYCGDCDTLQNIVDEDYALEMSIQDRGFGTKLTENSITADSECSTGFGDVEVVGSCGIYRLESGVAPGELYGTVDECEIDIGDDDDEDDDDIATKYRTQYAFIVVVVAAFIKLF